MRIYKQIEVEIGTLQRYSDICQSVLALNRSKKAWPTDVVILTYLTDKLKHKSHILIYCEILGFMSRLDHVVQIMNNTNITFLSQSLLDYFQGHSSGKICHHEHYCHLNMIFAYIYTLISRGQFTKNTPENVRETRAYHLYICCSSSYFASGQFCSDPQSPISSVFNFKH